jgi:hydrogenase maturation factor HypE
MVLFLFALGYFLSTAVLGQALIDGFTYVNYWYNFIFYAALLGIAVGITYILTTNKDKTDGAIITIAASIVTALSLLFIYLTDYIIMHINPAITSLSELNSQAIVSITILMIFTAKTASPGISKTLKELK